MKFRSRHKTLIGILLCIPIFGYFNFIDDNVDRVEFNSAIWKSTPAEFSLESMRLRMVDDFLNKYDAIGMSRGEIVKLLGEPDDTSYFKAYEMVYMLGQETESYFAIDSQWLLFKLSDSGEVTSYVIAAD